MFKAFCDCCNKTVNVIENFELMEKRTINGEIVSIIGRVANCCFCNMDVIVPEFEIMNLEQVEHVIEMKEKYEGE
jgi:hypothetical protein